MERGPLMAGCPLGIYLQASSCTNCGDMPDSAGSTQWLREGVVMEDRIEQRITIRSTQDKVWQLVTRPGWWLPGSKTEPARSPGRVSVEYSGDIRPYAIEVVRVEPQGNASFRWASAFGGVTPAPGNATLIEFYLR